MSGNQHDEGHTVAGWTGCLVAVAGSVVTGLGVVGWRPGIWLGLAVVASAALLTWVLHLAGWGKPPGPRPAGQLGLAVRDSTARGGHGDCLGCRLAGRRGVPASTVLAPTPTATASPADLSS
ncbi:hypothetical protein GCM10022384_11730 [Streptomyces marokkonensis]|uniref:Uncharacterized protein n=1 Tax=Streptomyces marokkonensis TaxID=324855 RepID=A0ABP7P879_9ACTN